jgi:ankyrin repeat protein
MMARNSGRAFAALIILAMPVLAAMPAAAQNYSDSFTFLEAVRKRDGAKVQAVLGESNPVAINARDRGSGEGALHIVTRARDLAWLSFLLGKGARPDLQNIDGNGALALAAQIGWTDGAQALIARRATVDMPNSRGETPLILAVLRRDLAMTRLLLAAGADPRRSDSVAGYSAIDYAKRDTRAGPILRLLEAPRAPLRTIAGPSR